MKKALLLTGLFLCASSIYAEEKPVGAVADGKKRNEEAYERMLEQTGWKNETTSKVEKPTPPAHQTSEGTSQPKSS